MNCTNAYHGLNPRYGTQCRSRTRKMSCQSESARGNNCRSYKQNMNGCKHCVVYNPSIQKQFHSAPCLSRRACIGHAKSIEVPCTLECVLPYWVRTSMSVSSYSAFSTTSVLPFHPLPYVVTEGDHFLTLSARNHLYLATITRSTTLIRWLP